MFEWLKIKYNSGDEFGSLNINLALQKKKTKLKQRVSLADMSSRWHCFHFNHLRALVQF